MTVSKALRDAHDVSATTKTRIKLLAQQLGYVPDSSAQGLRTRTTKLFGLAVSSLTNPIFSRVVLAIEERAYELGYDVLLAHSLNIPEREEACLRRFISRRVDGVFIAPAYRMAAEARIYQELASRKIPTVLLGHPASFCTQFPNVSTDDLLGSYAATQHLLKLGHKRIAFFVGPLPAPWVVTAVQSVNDLVAVGCAQALLKQGLKIPEDISIVGFGNILLSEYFSVPLTTVRQPKFRLGVAAMETMQQLLQGRRAESKRLPAELLVRASSGIAPAIEPLLGLNTASIKSI